MRRSAVLLSAAVALAAACGDSPSEPNWDDLLAELETRRAAWEASRPRDYTMVQEHDCNCPAHQLEPAIISVTDEVVTGGIWEADSSAISANDLELFLSVRELFELARNAGENRVLDLRVQYSEDLGYPRTVVIDYTRGQLTDDRAILVSGLTPLIPE